MTIILALKKILSKGSCFYVPQKWIYSFRTNYAWTYRVSWSLKENFDTCEESTGNGTLSVYKFKAEESNQIENFEITYGIM